MDTEILHANEHLADAVDRAALEAERDIAQALERAKAGAAKPLPYIGRCYNCSEPLPDQLRFCDEFCREDYDYREARRKVNGG